MKRKLTLLFLVVLLGGMTRLQATHIVGAELYYECINAQQNNYRITLKLYRDCLAGQADFDDEITLFAFNSQTGRVDRFISMFVPNQTPEIIPEEWDACVGTPRTICVEEGIYTTTAILPPLPGGYDLAWARCCRNAAIDNLRNPLGEGITYLAHIPSPDLAACNSMPRFNNLPPIFLCEDETFAFDHSASDADGDSLSYAITNPYTGTNNAGLGAGNPNQGGNQPVVDPFVNPMGPPPYRNVSFAPGFTFDDPFGSGDFNIDPTTGFITVTPDRTGIFVFSISTFEWRDGNLLSETRRDFQIHIIQCRPQDQPPLITHEFGNLPNNNDTLFIEANTPFCYDVSVTDPNLADALTAYTVSAPFGNGFFFPPVATFEFSGLNPLEGEVCWQPSCSYDGQTIPLILGARDISDCPNISDVFDTVWVKITAPPDSPPEITPDYGNLTTKEDTIIIAPEQPFCYDFTVTDADPGALEAFPISPIFQSNNPPSLTFSGSNPLRGQICWEPSCELQGQVVEITVGARDDGGCGNGNTVQNTTFIRILAPDNSPPGITTDLSGNLFREDTLFVDALEETCFTFRVDDPNADDELEAFTLSPIFQGDNPPSFNVTGTNPLRGEICWAPGCEYEDEVIPLIFGARDAGACNTQGEIVDTVFVKVNVPPNDPPIISTDLSGNTVSNDTIFVNANEDLCYNFRVNDPNTTDILEVLASSPIFSDPNGPDITFSGNNPVQGEICWSPGCEFVGQVFPLTLNAQDNAPCSAQRSVENTVFVAVGGPENNLPQTSHDLRGLEVIGDTIFVDPEDSFCYVVSLSDPDAGDTLTAFTVSPLFEDDSTASFTFRGTNPVEGEVCWAPSCEYQGQLVPLIIGVEDNGDCDVQLAAFDTVYVKISDPELIPPIVTSDLSGNEFNGDTIFIDEGESLCYTFLIQDRTLATGLDYTFEFQQFDGTNINLGSADVTIGDTSIEGEICFNSDCTNGGSLYRLIVTGLDAATCPPFAEDKDTVFVKVNTEFITSLGTDIEFCQGAGGAQLTVDVDGGEGPYFYDWGCTDDPDCGFSDPFISNPIVNPSASTTYYVQVTDRFGCTSEIDSIQVTVNPLPLVDAGPDLYLCEGETGGRLQASIINADLLTGDIEVEWSPAEGLDDPNSLTPFASPAQSTIYTLVVRSATGCSSSSTTLDTLSTVGVFFQESPTADAGDDTEICEGTSTTLLGFATGGGPAYEFEWTPATGLSDPFSQTPEASPTETTTYYLTTSSNGCPGETDSVTITVRPQPVPESLADAEICALDSVRLNATVVGDPGNSYIYEWEPPLGLDDPTSATPMASPDSTTTYVVTAQSDAGCRSEPFQITVNVRPTPLANAGADAFVCGGDSAQLLGSYVMLAGDPTLGPVSYSWSAVTGLSDPSIQDPKAAPTESAFYTLTTTYENCSTTDEVKIDVFNAVSVQAGSDKTQVCRGEDVQLFASGGSGAGIYSWTPEDGLSDPNIANPMVQPQQTTTYVVTINEVGCSATDSIEVIVDPTPEVSFIQDPGSGCEGMRVNLSETVEGAISWSWDFGDGISAGQVSNPTHVYENAGEYNITLSAVGDNGCTASFTGPTISVFPKGIANFTSAPDTGVSAFLPNVTIDFTDQSVNAVSYQWDFGDGNTSTEANPRHNYTEPGNYTVTLIIFDEGGCPDTLARGLYNVLSPELFIPNVFSPNDDGVNDAFVIRYLGSEPFSMEVFDRWGRRMFETPVFTENGWNGRTSDGSLASEGVYYYVITVGEESYKGNVTLLR